ncbi:MAG: hypothetical protein ACWGSD_06180 [Thermodesulfobacteriota bacterium]
MIYDFEGNKIFSLCEGIAPEKKKWRTIGRFCNVGNNGCTALGTETPLIIKALKKKFAAKQSGTGFAVRRGIVESEAYRR